MPETKVALYRKKKNHNSKTGIDRYADSLINSIEAIKTNFSVNTHYVTESYRKIFVNAFLLGNSNHISDKSAQINHALFPMPVAGKSSRPYIVTIHDLCPIITPEVYPKYTPYLFKKTLKNLNNNGAYFITNSKSTNTDLLNFMHIPADRIRMVYMGINKVTRPDAANSETNIERIVSKYKLPEVYFLFIGAMNKRKNIDKLLEAFKECLNIYGNNVKLVLAGRMNWGGDEVIKLVNDLKLEQHIHFTGYIDEEDLNAVIGLSRALLYVSKYEGFGFPVLEGMACGTAVICSNVSSLPEVGGDAALLVDPNSVQSIAGAMVKVLTDDGLRDELIALGNAQYQKFTWEKTAADTLNYYTDILNQ